MLKWNLVIEDDAGNTMVVHLKRDVITIGRQEGNTIRLTERNVSRRHARIQLDGTQATIEDLSSYNGVKINGDRIKQRTTIQEGDLIEVGDYHLTLQSGDADKPALAASRSLAASARHKGARLSEVDDSDDFAGDTQRWSPQSDNDLRTAEVAVTPMTASRDADKLLGTLTPPAIPSALASPRPVSLAAPAAPRGRPIATDEDKTEQLVIPKEALADVHSPLASSVPPSAAGLPPPPALGFVAPTLSMAAQNAPGASHLVESGHAGKGQDRQQDRQQDKQAEKNPVENLGKNLDKASEKNLEKLADRTVDGIPMASLAVATNVPRLAVISSVFAGSVFALKENEIVVGRTDDNTIVIEHRSVSRNHAKLVKLGDVYKIIDLKSVNGVVLNGKDIHQEVLRSGDIIELGKVKLRYLSAGEQWQLSTEEIEKARREDLQGEDFPDDPSTFYNGDRPRVGGAQSGTPSGNYGTPARGNGRGDVSNDVKSGNKIPAYAWIGILVLALAVFAGIAWMNGGNSNDGIKDSEDEEPKAKKSSQVETKPDGKSDGKTDSKSDSKTDSKSDSKPSAVQEAGMALTASNAVVNTASSTAPNKNIDANALAKQARRAKAYELQHKAAESTSQSNFAAAKSFLEQAVQQFPDEPTLYRDLAEVYKGLKDDKKACEFAKQYQAKDPNAADAVTRISAIRGCK